MESNDTVDDFYFSALHESEQIFPISDENYSLELQLQEVLMSSIISSRNICQPFKSRSGRETGDSSDSKMQETFLCPICMDVKSISDTFSSKTCSHLFCSDCITKYLAAKIQDNIVAIKCPDLKCKATLEPQFCRSVVPEQVFDRWESALTESMIFASQKFYCPFKDCSALLENDESKTVVTAECRKCHRMFCALCKVPWHAGVTCPEFQNLREDERSNEDIMLMNLAKSNEWRRCSKCMFYVEKIDGCLHIECRCGHQFCYRCGSDWSQIHPCDFK